MNPRRVAVIVLACTVFALLWRISVSRNIFSETIHPTVDDLRFRNQIPKTQKELEKPNKKNYIIINRNVALEILPPSEGDRGSPETDADSSNNWKHVRNEATHDEGYVAGRLTETVENKVPLGKAVTEQIIEAIAWITTVRTLVGISMLASIMSLFLAGADCFVGSGNGCFR